MTPHDFIAKWQKVNLSERSACQQHFLDLCELLGQPKPAAADPDGAWYTFERGVSKSTGGHGWADVWMRNHFGWEYKGKHKDLDAAYQQLLLYREDLENPPLLVVCDLDRFEIHTNFTGTVKTVHRFALDGLAEPKNLDTLRKVFTDPESLRPGLTTESITQQAAERFGLLADGMRVRGIAAPDAAHFLMKLMFCMFGEDIGLLPPNVFGRVLDAGKDDPARLSQLLASLFQAMQKGGYFGADQIAWFNGGLFADADVIDLQPSEIAELVRINEHDWANVEPSVFGTLFERTLDPSKRAQIGAHYTSRDDILTIVEPVVMIPLRRQWQDVQAKCEKQWQKVEKAARKSARRAATPSKAVRDFERLLLDFIEHLAHVTILDPACGSGNFLYVAIRQLLDLEKEVIAYGASHGVSLLPQVRPTQLAGIEINPYAQQLAQVVIWIGYLQWMRHNGFNPPRNPVLEPIESIKRMDAIIDLTDPDNPKEPEWPTADFIVGNPPFVGGNKIRAELGDAYVDRLFNLYHERVPAFADLCCYWFDKARKQIERKKCDRAGLLATQGIRGGANRKVLDRIKESGDIFFAESDRDWILDGAAVHVSMVGFDDGTESEKTLDGISSSSINANLTSHVDVGLAKPLCENQNICFMGASKKASFDITNSVALDFVHVPNPNGRPNSDVVRPWANGLDITRRHRDMWIIDFGNSMRQEVAALYEAPFEYAKQTVKPQREGRREKRIVQFWWRFARPRVEMRTAIAGIERFIVTPAVSKHRVFVRLPAVFVPDQQLLVFATSNDFDFGVLHSRAHETWARAQGTQVRERESGFRYTPTTCFETFPFPEPTDDQRASIADAAKELDQLRSNWLNPPQWTREEVLEFPGSADGPWARYVHGADARGIGAVRYPRLVPKDAECEKQLKKRTLTNLYNERPAWLDLAHRKLDEAVFAAYGWNPEMPDEEILADLLQLNLAHAGS